MQDGHEHRSKKAKQMLVVANEASFRRNISKEELHTQHTSTNAWIAEAGMPNLLNHPIPIEAEAPIPHSINITPPLSRPPFLFYGSFIDVPQATWKKLSQFLNNIEPEFVNTRFFSAIIRKEGYIHNLPEGNRAGVFQESPMTIEEALPHTRRWWPPWDSRKQFSFTSSDSLSAEILCRDLGEMLRTSRGMPSKEQQNRILRDCSMMNLVWIGENKLGPVAPNEMECILGYPNQHTEVFGMELDDRMRVLKDCFQINTLAYHLSTLRNVFPEGVRLLSVYSGIGGAEIALHRLGIHLKCVVSVETDERNHEILKRWWQCTEQTGELLKIEGVKNVTTSKLSGIINNLGGIDVIVGRTLPASKNVSRVRRSDSIDMSAFFEFARVFQQVKCITKGV
ncbi:DNA (cytosine-5)-methyltransferase DRM2 [Apostasia shenzhenica]|uniref:DNA (Cytosine-5)-methyltransferase DRM2 n=1 Tax=Apostasia shenzhenica TaxID=1088818 RepID=A0A2I0A048_9ASPA|nr:DNA (cytosine-5)-methyltransferase DRM2 [Apostasia shenzhenica]